ncbi:Chorea-acanthocytosis protein [Intoshia linei]|uniref:Chorea-acanthocytosis protein n=1 Tax=Intoshia linei TaxID=1819745 RepID=A0A177AYQ2_9BILA|nr:Chorea-acanthocytosis protein [Intoshia linei]
MVFNTPQRVFLETLVMLQVVNNLELVASGVVDISLLNRDNSCCVTTFFFHILTYHFFDGTQYNSIESLWHAIKQVSSTIQPERVKKLTDSVDGRLIKLLKIDNQLKSAMYTVALGSIQRHSTENKPFAEASVMMRTILNSNIIQFKYFKVLIQEIITQIDQNFINTLLSFFVDKYSDINDDLKIKNVKIENFEQNLDMTDYSLNEFSQSRDDEKRNFFDNLHISPLKIQLTFTLSSRLGTSDNTILLFLKNIGFLLTDIRDVCFKLGYFERNGEFYTTSTLLSEIQTHYYQQAIKEAYALVLGLDVLGNPYGVLTGFATGIEDLFYEPYKGAIEGPQEFFTGVATGLRSFFGHTIGGAAGAFSRIAGTFGKGISVLSFDKKHQKLRRKRMNKTPDDFGEGIRSGGKHLIRGIFDGVTGIITQPIEGAKDEGAGGFFKGLGVGLVGVVTRPVGGVVDFASSTLDGIKSSTECKKALKRIRPPRYMGENFVVRPYNLYKALGVSVIQDVDNGKYSTTDTYVAHTYTSNCKKHMLVATNKRILYIKTDSLMKNWVSMFTYNWSTITSEPKLTGDKIYIQCNIKKLFGRVDHGKKFTIINTQEAKEFTQATKLFYQSYTN